MTDWTAGYVSDIGYTYGYYPELNPLRLRLIFLNAGLVPPEVGTACELGFGQGMSINLHAAASATAWYGTDFNPTQAGFAQELAKVSGADVRLFDEAFADFANRIDLPDFDYIGLHGIWSWISDENRDVIVDFVRRKLKVGGVLYISYNTQPGWAVMGPMRDLLSEHSEKMSTSGQGIVSRIDAALEFADKLLATNPTYARANPQVANFLKNIKGQSRNYLAHEYFNRDWLPMSFAHMSEWLSPAKLNYTCSAHYLDHIDALNLTADQQALLREIPDAMFRETVRDFMINQQFRREYWVKGTRKLNMLALAEALRAQQLVLAQPRADVSLKVIGRLGEAKLQDAVYNPILDALIDHQPRTIGQIEQAVKAKGINFVQVIQAAIVLSGSGALQAVQDDAAVIKAKMQTSKLNTFLIDRARGSGEVNYLASPVIGGGVAIGRFQQMFLEARTQGKKDQPDEWAQYVWQILAAQGQKLIKEGKALETEAENIAELKAQARSFAEKNLPILKALQII
jgi:SAM-dependent methyltransferase